MMLAHEIVTATMVKYVLEHCCMSSGWILGGYLLAHVKKSQIIDLSKNYNSITETC